ncbi:hypothetical protein Cs7R123_06420 [Catellatospora sp. TT07R-123]|uniref:hypothetical protein n=1 Tax=Catellatospora sp. TT07R-123 TaxID=2733863 RepID=UPI001B009EF5|nr:hypothetical protein [Catellatospora sp. TT07R-123]GHJ43300.1 hypothetical protein Cs7R123_06420 [Catellatospora sp. TT07R-123]
MSSASCGQCPTLHATIAQQQAEITRLTGWVQWYRAKLAALTGAVMATERLMRDEFEQPSMPRGHLLSQVHERLTIALLEAEGK